MQAGRTSSRSEGRQFSVIIIIRISVSKTSMSIRAAHSRYDSEGFVHKFKTVCNEHYGRIYLRGSQFSGL